MQHFLLLQDRPFPHRQVKLRLLQHRQVAKVFLCDRTGKLPDLTLQRKQILFTGRMIRFRTLQSGLGRLHGAAQSLYSVFGLRTAMEPQSGCGLNGLSAAFVKAMREAMESLAQDEACLAYMKKLSEYLEQFETL